MEEHYYPQGSLSSNTLYYEGIRNYHGGRIPDRPGFNLLRQGLIEFLSLRRDDSAANRSYLFGSTYHVETTISQKSMRRYRVIDVSVRHSASALLILLQESGDQVSALLVQSLEALHEACLIYFDEGSDDWKYDKCRHFTISSVISVCRAGLDRNLSTNLHGDLTKLLEKCESKLFSDGCASQDLIGKCYFGASEGAESWIYHYEFFLACCALRHIPQLLRDARLQLVIETILENRVESEAGYGIPLKRRTRYGPKEKVMPDFGTTACMLRLVWYSLEYDVGGEEWLSYCNEQFGWLLSFCLNAFDKREYYTFTLNESNAQILFMPRYTIDRSRNESIDTLVATIKKVIRREIIVPKGKLDRSLKAVDMPVYLNHLRGLIEQWEIEKYWKKGGKWTLVQPDNKEWLGTAASMAGEFTGGLLKSIAHLP
jgi:hypothetical protein